MRITKRRAETHIRRQRRVRNNCRYLSPGSSWKPFKAGWDRGAFREEGRTIYITCDGSSRPFEWISNARVFARKGFHRGFRRAAVRGVRDIKEQLKHPLSYYDEIVWDWHSRGVFGAIMGCFMWADYLGFEWEETDFALLLSQFHRFRDKYPKDVIKQSAVATGIPVFCDMPVLYE